MTTGCAHQAARITVLGAVDPNVLWPMVEMSGLTIANAGRGLSSAQEPPVQLVFGDYVVTQVIGEGGMGRVYRALQPRLNRAVCVKTLLPHFASDPEISRRFAVEATTTAALSHPNIVSIIDVGTTPAGVAYMVMELVDGRQLRVILRDESPVAASRAVMLMDQVLAALAEAHTHGVVHRDLKPANVLVVSQRDGAELCKLLDFGIARVVTEGAERLTRTGMMVGTPGYMAPEQIAGDEVDHRADLYAAGAILYELLCGERVFRAPSDIELFKKVMLEDPVPPSTRTRSPVAASLDAVCLKALARPARARFSSASEFREALAQAMRARPSGPATFSGIRIECTPLATAVAPRSTSETNAQALVAAVLVASDAWERSRLIDPLERALREALAAGEFKVLHTTITALQDELKLKGAGENLKLLFDMTRALITEQLPLLLEWLADEKGRSGARWLLLLLGRSAFGTYLRQLPGLRPEVQGQLMEVIRTIDPDVSLLVAQVKGLEADVLEPLLLAARGWPAVQAYAVLSAALQSSDAGARLTALQSLDESNAFRLGVVVRQRLHDPSLPVRTEALHWVFRLEDDAAVPDLVRLLQRPGLSSAERKAVWRTLSRLKTDAAVDILSLALTTTADLDEVAELASLLVRTQSPEAVRSVRAQLARSRTHPRRKAVLEEALREV